MLTFSLLVVELLAHVVYFGFDEPLFHILFMFVPLHFHATGMCACYLSSIKIQSSWNFIAWQMMKLLFLFDWDCVLMPENKCRILNFSCSSDIYFVFFSPFSCFLAVYLYFFFAFWSWEFDCEHLEKLTVHTSTETRNNKHITNEHAPKTQQWYCIFGITLTIFAYIRFARLCVLVCVCVWAHCVTYLLIYRPFVSKSGICG